MAYFISLLGLAIAISIAALHAWFIAPRRDSTRQAYHALLADILHRQSRTQELRLQKRRGWVQ